MPVTKGCSSRSRMGSGPSCSWQLRQWNARQAGQARLWNGQEKPRVWRSWIFTECDDRCETQVNPGSQQEVARVSVLLRLLTCFFKRLSLTPLWVYWICIIGCESTGGEDVSVAACSAVRTLSFKSWISGSFDGLIGISKAWHPNCMKIWRVQFPSH